MLSELHYPFSVIGLPETKIKSGQENIINIELQGYQFISQPSISNAGGVGCFIHGNLDISILSDLTLTKENIEALWIEVHNSSQRNTLCAIIYRHPQGSVDQFMEYLNLCLEKTHRERKYCIIMGDFNLDLLKYESHEDTDNFINTLGSFFFHPQILQPTRITDHSATLIDNIFLNSIEHFTISGNIVYDLTDHLPNFLIIHKATSPSNK